jgi:hypothetical protein
MQGTTEIDFARVHVQYLSDSYLDANSIARIKQYCTRIFHL